MSFDADVCRRLPLADATLHLLNFVADSDFLAALFQQHRGRCYQRKIAFAPLVHLLADALVQNGQSANRTFQQAHDTGVLNASVRAAYNKLACLPPPLSAALLTDATARLRHLLPTAPTEAVPDSLAAFTPLAFDAKKIKYVARRLKATRVVRGSVIGGKILVAEDIKSGLAVAMEAHPDGEASDLILVAGLLARTRPVIDGPRLWIADALFCDLTNLPTLAAEGDHFVVRYCGKVTFHPDPKRPAKTGTNRLGQRFTQEWGWLGGPDDPRRFCVRRVTVHRPGLEDVSVVSDLTDGKTYPAADLLEIYLRRWGIERLFQKVTEVFHLSELVSAQSNGTVFQAGLCLLLYNLTVVIRAHVAAGAACEACEACEAIDISLEKVFVDLCRQLSGLVEVLGTPAVVSHYADTHWTAEDLRGYLAEMLGKTWRKWWKKSPTRAASPPTPTEYLVGGHSSVFKITRGLHRTVPEPTRSPRPSKQ